jgi:hypothetical protein
MMSSRGGDTANDVGNIRPAANELGQLGQEARGRNASAVFQPRADLEDELVCAGFFWRDEPGPAPELLLVVGRGSDRIIDHQLRSFALPFDVKRPGLEMSVIDMVSTIGMSAVAREPRPAIPAVNPVASSQPRRTSTSSGPPTHIWSGILWTSLPASASTAF